MKKSIVAVFSLFAVAVLVFMFTHTRKATPSSSFQTISHPISIRSFGVIELSEHVMRHFDLGTSNGWIVTAKPLSNDNIEVDMLPDETNTNGIVQKDASRGVINAVRMTTPPSQPISCELGGVVVRFTPYLKP